MDRSQFQYSAMHYLFSSEEERKTIKKFKNSNTNHLCDNRNLILVRLCEIRIYAVEKIALSTINGKQLDLRKLNTAETAVSACRENFIITREMVTAREVNSRKIPERLKVLLL